MVEKDKKPENLPDAQRLVKHRYKTLYSILPIIAIAAIGLLAYSNTLNCPFLFDDQAHITDNPPIRLTELTLQGLADAAFKSPLPERPVANITFALNYFFHRYNVVGYHLTNITIHILSAVFLYLLLKNTLALPLLRDRFRHSQYLAFAAAILWLLHPIQIQAVTYIVQRMTSMAAMFYIMSMYFYVKGRLAFQIKKRSWHWFLACAFSGILSFGCKEITATLPLFILLYEWFFFQDLKAVWLKKQTLFIIAAFFLLAVLSFLYLSVETVRKMAVEYQQWGFSATEKLLTEFRVTIFYISLLLYPNPARLNLDHDFAISKSLFAPPQTVICMIIVLVIILSAFLLAKRYRLLSFCIFWFLGNLLIESSSIGIELIYEHRLYLPSMFAILAFAALLWKLLRPNLLKAAVFTILALMLLSATFQRNKVWADGVTLWSDCVAKSPNRPRSNFNLACAFYEKSDYEQAIKYYNTTLQLNPNRSDAYEGLGSAYLSDNKITEAVEYCNKALLLNPKAARAYYIKGLALYRQNLLDQAIANFKRSIELNPRLDRTYNDLAFIYNHQGQFEKAAFCWNKAIQINPEQSESLNNLAWLRATQPDKKYRNSAESIRLAEKANKITDYKQPDFLDTLAAAYADAGQFDKATSFAEKAIESATAQGNNKLAETIKGRLDLYKMRQPFIDTPGQSNTEEKIKMQEKK
jgi:tetratricopeptide (TPR) repeat protein